MLSGWQIPAALDATCTARSDAALAKVLFGGGEDDDDDDNNVQEPSLLPSAESSLHKVRRLAVEKLCAWLSRAAEHHDALEREQEDHLVSLREHMAVHRALELVVAWGVAPGLALAGVWPGLLATSGPTTAQTTGKFATETTGPQPSAGALVWVRRRCPSATLRIGPLALSWGLRCVAQQQQQQQQQNHHHHHQRNQQEAAAQGGEREERVKDVPSEAVAAFSEEISTIEQSWAVLFKLLTCDSFAMLLEQRFLPDLVACSVTLQVVTTSANNETNHMAPLAAFSLGSLVGSLLHSLHTQHAFGNGAEIAAGQSSHATARLFKQLIGQQLSLCTMRKGGVHTLLAEMLGNVPEGNVGAYSRVVAAVCRAPSQTNERDFFAAVGSQVAQLYVSATALPPASGEHEHRVAHRFRIRRALSMIVNRCAELQSMNDLRHTVLDPMFRTLRAASADNDNSLEIAARLFLALAHDSPPNGKLCEALQPYLCGVLVLWVLARGHAPELAGSCQHALLEYLTRAPLRVAQVGLLETAAMVDELNAGTDVDVNASIPRAPLISVIHDDGGDDNDDGAPVRRQQQAIRVRVSRHGCFKVVNGAMGWGKIVVESSELPSQCDNDDSGVEVSAATLVLPGEKVAVGTRNPQRGEQGDPTTTLHQIQEDRRGGGENKGSYFRPKILGEGLSDRDMRAEDGDELGVFSETDRGWGTKGLCAVVQRWASKEPRVPCDMLVLILSHVARAIRGGTQGDSNMAWGLAWGIQLAAVLVADGVVAEDSLRSAHVSHGNGKGGNSLVLCVGELMGACTGVLSCRRQQQQQQQRQQQSEHQHFDASQALTAADILPTCAAIIASVAQQHAEASMDELVRSVMEGGTDPSQKEERRKRNSAGCETNHFDVRQRELRALLPILLEVSDIKPELLESALLIAGTPAALVPSIVESVSSAIELSVAIRMTIFSEKVSLPLPEHTQPPGDMLEPGNNKVDENSDVFDPIGRRIAECVAEMRDEQATTRAMGVDGLRSLLATGSALQTTKRNERAEQGLGGIMVGLDRVPKLSQVHVMRVVDLLLVALRDADPYVFLGAIRALSLAIERHPELLFDAVMDKFAHPTTDAATRARLGEVLVLATRRAGDTLPLHVPRLVPLMVRCASVRGNRGSAADVPAPTAIKGGNGVYSGGNASSSGENGIRALPVPPSWSSSPSLSLCAALRTSSLAVLATACADAPVASMRYAQDILSLVEGILKHETADETVLAAPDFGVRGPDMAVDVRRAAAVVLEQMVAGMARWAPSGDSCRHHESVVSSQPEAVRDAYRLLKAVLATEADPVVKAHVEAGLGHLRRVMTSVLFPSQSQQQQKELRVSVLDRLHEL